MVIIRSSLKNCKLDMINLISDVTNLPMEFDLKSCVAGADLNVYITYVIKVFYLHSNWEIFISLRRKEYVLSFLWKCCISSWRCANFNDMQLKGKRRYNEDNSITKVPGTYGWFFLCCISLTTNHSRFAICNWQFATVYSPTNFQTFNCYRINIMTTRSI